MENREINEKGYRCVYCGKNYSTPEGMAKCVLTCGEKRKREQLKKDRLKEIQDLTKKLNSLATSYRNDYGVYIYWR